MPIPVQRKCPKCKGESDQEGVCLACDIQEYYFLDGAKYVPPKYLEDQEKDGNQRLEEEKRHLHNQHHHHHQ